MSLPCYIHNININKPFKKKIVSDELEKEGPNFFFAYGKKKARNKISRLRRIFLRAQNCVLRCAQPASQRLLRKTAILTQTLRPRTSATAN